MTTDTKAPGGASLVINRAKWLRGEADESMLLRPSDGKMCCLGFLGVACGFSADHLGNHPSPDCVPDAESDRWPSWLCQYVDEKGYYRDTDDCNDLIRANDNKWLSASEREAKIAGIFAKHGVTVTFIDGDSQ